MQIALPARTRLAIAAGLILLITVAANLNSVVAPASQVSLPFPLSAYGVVRVSATQSFATSGGYARLRISTDGTAPFFVVRVVVMMNTPVEADIILDSITIDGSENYPLSSFSPKVTVVPAGTTYGEIITSLSDRLPILLVKEPMGNNAVSASGGTNNGIVFVLRFSTGTYNIGSTMSATALVTAPTNSTVSIAIS